MENFLSVDKFSSKSTKFGVESLPPPFNLLVIHLFIYLFIIWFTYTSCHSLQWNIFFCQKFAAVCRKNHNFLPLYFFLTHHASVTDYFVLCVIVSTRRLAESESVRCVTRLCLASVQGDIPVDNGERSERDGIRRVCETRHAARTTARNQVRHRNLSYALHETLQVCACVAFRKSSF